jgi:hypothetical protein
VLLLGTVDCHFILTYLEWIRLFPVTVWLKKRRILNWQLALLFKTWELRKIWVACR